MFRRATLEMDIATDAGAGVGGAEMNRLRFGPGLLVTAAFIGPGTIVTASRAKRRPRREPGRRWSR